MRWRVCTRYEEFCQQGSLGRGHRRTQTEIDETNAAVGEEEDVARVWIAVEHATYEYLVTMNAEDGAQHRVQVSGWWRAPATGTSAAQAGLRGKAHRTQHAIDAHGAHSETANPLQKGASNCRGFRSLTVGPAPRFIGLAVDVLLLHEHVLHVRVLPAHAQSFEPFAECILQLWPWQELHPDNIALAKGLDGRWDNDLPREFWRGVDRSSEHA
mmetsp:Transcript_57882/g.149564  ORF Transcript_57882/g.149564 Transcript_57882/m.149564 type:complete len:213 (+) Transcript_57882:466-1104(+)